MDLRHFRAGAQAQFNAQSALLNEIEARLLRLDVPYDARFAFAAVLTEIRNGIYAEARAVEVAIYTAEDGAK